ncbi:U32 family peptidase [Methanobrevibacter curvatus]|nr:U32 family peptidase [Methanobrevibacter curvatus]
MELLAPAGSFEIFKIAVNSGADAVYISGKNFGARAFAENFTTEEIKKSVEYGHLNNVKVFITINTLINNFEIIDILKYVFKLYKIGVDAIIVQDFGVLKLIQSLFPKIKIHSSTQMTINNFYSSYWAVENGISRIIFPRELSIDEITDINKKLKEKNLNVELEVFSHGALCYSISGNCYISSYNNGRSGNRGACTQPCRRQYNLKYKGHKVDEGYLLSTYDLNTINNLKLLENAGIDSIKLEGRMKSSDYVSTVVNSYKNILDGNEGDYIHDLNMVFNRKFTNGYLLNEKPGNVMGRESSGHKGFYIGEVVELKENLISDSRYDKKNKNSESNKSNNNSNNRNNKNYNYKNFENNKNKNYEDNKNYENSKNYKKNKLENEGYEKEFTEKTVKVLKKNKVDINIGDGIAFEMGDKIKGIYLDNIISQNDSQITFKTTRNLRIGDKVYVSYSHLIHKELKKIKKEYIQSKIAVSLKIKLNSDLTATIDVKFNLNNKKYEFNYKSSEKFEKAINRPTTLEDIEKQLFKTGNTPFYIDNIQLSDYLDDLYIPISSLNKIRREIIKEGEKILLNHYKTDKKESNKAKTKLNHFIKQYKSLDYTIEKKRLNVSVFVDNIKQLKVASDYPLKKIYFDPSYLYTTQESFFENIEETLVEAGKNITTSELVWVLPSFISDSEIIKSKEIFNNLREKGIPISIISENPGLDKVFDTNIYGNHNLNVWNSFSCEILNESNFKSLILSSELSKDEIKEISKKSNLDIEYELLVHGNLEVITSKDDFSNLKNEYTQKNEKGETTEKKDNSLKMENGLDYAILEDKKRKKFKYKVFFDFNKKSHIINKDCLCLIDELGKIANLGLDSIILDCRYSNENYTSNIISLYLKGLDNLNKKNLIALKNEIQNISQSYLTKGNFLEGRLHEN